MSAEKKLALMKWAMYSLGISLIPVGCIVILLGVQGQALDYRAIFGGGELLVVNGSLGATAVGDVLVYNKKRNPLLIALFAGICFFAVLTCFYTYAVVVASNLQKISYDEKFVVLVSIWMFIVTVISSGICVALTSGKK